MSKRGTVKWYNPNKGFGFIVPETGGNDVFVHVSAIEDSGLKALNEGDVVEFDLSEDRGKTKAVNIRKAA